MMTITRDVVTDLWPVYEAGEASRDTRAVVEEFLAGDPELARALRAKPALEPPGVVVPPDAEASSLRRTRDLVHGHSWLRGLRLAALVFTIFSVGRIISDTSWDVSPRVFIVDATLAIVCWVSYGLLLHRYRSRSLRLAKRP
jgi:anti-sigma factor RsiW